MLRLLLGNDPLFQVPQYQLVDPWEFGVYAVLGIVGGLVSAIFTKLLLRMRERFLRLPRKTLWVQPVTGGLLVGVMGWFVPQLLGVGYAHVGQALNGGIALKLMVLLLVLKLLSVTTSYASGNAGGIFGPSLFIGAMLGGIVGHAAQSLWPNHVAASGAYALVGMGTVFAGIVRLGEILDSRALGHARAHGAPEYFSPALHRERRYRRTRHGRRPRRTDGGPLGSLHSAAAVARSD